MNHTYHFFLLAALLLLLLWWMRPVSGASYNPIELTYLLNDAMTLWEGQNITHSQVTTQHECTKYGQSWKVDVDPIGIKQSRDVCGVPIIDKDVLDDMVFREGDFFTAIRGTIDRNALAIRVNYPTSINFIPLDHCQQELNDAMAMWNAHGHCHNGFQRLRLRDHKKLWKSFEIYSYTFANGRLWCNVRWSTDLGVTLIKKHDDRVVHERMDAVDGYTVDKTGSASTQIQHSLPGSEIALIFATIPDVYVQLQEPLNYDAYNVDAAFDKSFGYPSRLLIDQHAGTTLDLSLWATLRLLSIDETSASSVGTEKKRDVASMELFPTVVTFVLLTWILF
jgi:hypothetical protein